MTTFVDGPAKEQRLWLKRACIYLRVSQDVVGEWDGLDQPGDKPEPGEKLYAYKLTKRPGMCHVSRRPRSLSGFYPISEYKLLEPQPPQEIMQDNKLWGEWVDKNGVKPDWA